MRVIPADLRKRYEEEGWWSDDTIGDLLARGLAAAPDTAFTVHSDVRPWHGTFGEVESVARRLAAGLRARGVGPSDVIAFQLPNWMEAAATFWASALLGAVVVPIVHIYGRAEIGHILQVARPKVFITADRFGRMVHDPEVCADVPVVGVVGSNISRGSARGCDFDDLLAAEPMSGTAAVDPAGPALIAFTSGTTSVPKGVVHSHQTLVCETRQLADRNATDRGKQLTATPVGHFIGMVGAFLIPVLHAKPVNLADAWDPGKALALMKSDGLAVGGGPPYFVTSLLDHPDFTPDHLAHVQFVGLGGASVPVAVTQRLAGLGIVAFRAYGSTEHPSITASPHDAPERMRLLTDGRPMPGVEIRLASDGEILSRGPDLCLGYTDDALTAQAFDEEGWYRTGDIGVIDDEGCLTITDRKSDVIIRGGENISALELEEVLLGVPGVGEAAVVAVPDVVLGERAAAVLRLLPGHPVPTLGEVCTYFERAGLARQKWPELVVEMASFPRTASGKVRKHLIRGAVAERVLKFP
ncbi:AMP-binding protein [Rhodococcus sp. NPDC004095]